MLRASSTVMTPSLPTFFMASAMMVPIAESLFAEMVPTWPIIASSTFFEIVLSSAMMLTTAASMPRLTSIGLAPAVTMRRPSR